MLFGKAAAESKDAKLLTNMDEGRRVRGAEVDQCACPGERVEVFQTVCLYCLPWLDDIDLKMKVAIWIQNKMHV